MDASATSQNLDFYGFLERMRRPAAADLVRAVKSFIVSFTYQATDAENDSKKIQEFLMTMETTIKGHPLWAHAADEEIDCAIEFAAKELQKINSFRSPREKLLCIMNCCQVINNLLLNVSMSMNRTPAGADEFLPILIYVTIKANPPQLHSNLKFVQFFRRQTKLVSEVEYYLTNLISAKTFITNLNASSLSMEESEYQKNMQAARLASEVAVAVPSNTLGSSKDHAPAISRHGKEIHTGGSRYPYMEENVRDLTPEDVEKLLGLYKQIVTRYTLLSEALRRLSIDEDQLLYSVRDLQAEIERK
ncbi:vacuolar protein sorting-associated protein 9A-like isoform X2 [Typha latifolia]|uniref:vacuolar protein sorting-associated protein 9A-like isoform X2 n=1 Tax=Typha latifolia TaxID=4733 RepID=UPI003C2B2AD6